MEEGKPEVAQQGTKPEEKIEKNLSLEPFIHLLESSNRVRTSIEAGELDNLSSQQAFETIWQTHTGASIEEQARAFAEGGGYSVDEYIESLRAGKKPPGSLGSVRLVEGQTPMLFDLPEPPKSEVAKLFFETADNLLSSPDSAGDFAYMAGVLLQTYLNFIHPKLDGNGRSAEDWMLWWQKQLVQGSKQKAEISKPPDGSVTSFLNLAPTARIKADSIRSWYHHGLRARYGGKEDILTPPPFLKEEFRDLYSGGRNLMDSRSREMNQFRRAMFAFLTDKLNYQGEPKGFEQFIEDNSGEAVIVFKQIFANALTDARNLDCLQQYGFRMDNLLDLLAKTGQYVYRRFSREEAIKPEYLQGKSQGVQIPNIRQQ